MSIDKKIIETINQKIKDSNENDEISKILIEWLDQIDAGKKDFNTTEAIQALIDKIK